MRVLKPAIPSKNATIRNSPRANKVRGIFWRSAGFIISIHSVRHDFDISYFRKSIIHFPKGLKANYKSGFLNFIQGQTQWKVFVLLLQYLFVEQSMYEGNHLNIPFPLISRFCFCKSDQDKDNVGFSLLPRPLPLWVTLWPLMGVIIPPTVFHSSYDFERI